jgi:hypothetical protein
MLLPELTKMRHGSRLLAMDARLRMAHGDLTGAARDIVAIRSMAAHTRSDPMLTSFMVSLAMESIAATETEHWLAADKSADAR